MAATSDEELESLLQNFDRIYQDYKEGIAQLQLLKSSYDAEIRRREALEVTCNSLMTDNKRLTKMYTESLSKLAYQLEGRVKFQSLKEELKKVQEEHLSKEDEYRKAMDMLKQDHTLKIVDLEERMRCCLLQKQANEVTLNQLRQDLVASKSQIDILTNSLAQANANVELKYHQEIEDLRDWLLVEQEEKNELIKKLRIAEKELMICKMKQAEQQRESTSNHHVETLKQKIMKLRKENEVLKRQLLAPQFEVV